MTTFKCKKVALVLFENISFLRRNMIRLQAKTAKLSVPQIFILSACVLLFLNQTLKIKYYYIMPYKHAQIMPPVDMWVSFRMVASISSSHHSSAWQIQLLFTIR